MDEESEALVAEPVEAVGLVERADLRIGFFLCEKEWGEKYRKKKSEDAEHGKAHKALDLLRTITGLRENDTGVGGVRLPSDNRVWLTEFYRQQTGWLKARSAENMLRIVGLEHTIVDSLQHSIMPFVEREDDVEYLPMNVLIERCFIQGEQHINFWREWLRNGLSKSSRPPMIIPNTWRPRNHPFIRTYEIHPAC
jgi:hypothetical protein